MKLKVPKKLKAYTVFGVQFTGEADNNYYGACPYCGKKNKFYVNENTGMYDCKSCAEEGNTYTFLNRMVEEGQEDIDNDSMQEVRDHRGIRKSTLRKWGIGLGLGEWIFPVYNYDGKLSDVRRWTPERKGVYSTPGCSTGLMGCHKLKKLKKGSTIWICEGEWDAMALFDLLVRCGVKDFAVVCVPGANVFKKEWVEWFKDHHVIGCYDNDEPGQKGVEKSRKMLNKKCKSLSYIKWPKSLDDGYDVRDFINDMKDEGFSFQKILREFEGLVKEDDFKGKKKVSEESDEEDGDESVKRGKYDVVQIGSIANEDIPSFETVLETFNEWMDMNDDNLMALKLMLAVVITADFDWVPLWYWIVGPSGCGKTLLLSALQGSQRSIFRSSVTPKSLVSGFQSDEDASLLPMFDQRCVVLKDATEILACREQDKDEIFSVLRGAFDGNVQRSFGNGVSREYWLKFNWLGGTTPAIHGDSHANLGERFLKLEMFKHDDDPETTIWAAINGVGMQSDMELVLADVVGRFLSRHVTAEDLPPVPSWVKKKVLKLVQVVAALRAQVDKVGWSDPSVKYRPKPEYGTRLAIQLIQTGQALALALNKKKVDKECYAIMEKVAVDTAIGFHFDVVVAIAEAGGRSDPLTISNITGIPRSTLTRRLEDLALLGVINKTKLDKAPAVGMSLIEWSVAPKFLELWHDAGLTYKRNF